MHTLAAPAKAPLSRSTADRARFLFVDTVRFWSMFAVVALHCTETFRLKMPWIAQVIRTPCKFGTIGFFLISGFLLGGRLDKTSPVDYMKKRLKKVFLPWLFWLAAYSSADLLFHVVDGQTHLTANLQGLRHIAGIFKSAVVYTSYWFVPNLLIAMGVLLLFRRYLDDVRFGAGLLAVTLFYSVNIYFGWVPIEHTEALFGFVFFLWLGNYAALHIDELTAFVERVAMWKLVAAAVLSLAYSLLETRLLFQLHHIDPANTLRVTNQVYALIMVLLLFKLKTVTWPSVIDVPRQTFGIYLMHPVILMLFMRGFYRVMEGLHLTGLPASTMLGEWVMITAVSYSCSLFAARYIGSIGWMQWSIGVGPATTLGANERAPVPTVAAAPYPFQAGQAAVDQAGVR